MSEDIKVKEEEMRYTKEDMDKMLPEYLTLLDNGDEAESLQYLKDRFTNRPSDMLTFAGMVAGVLEDREDGTVKGKVEDNANTGVSDTAGAGNTEGPVPGQDDTVEPMAQSGSND